MAILGLLGYIISVVCFIIVLIHAFRNEIWKGIVALICGFYWLYYAIAEYDGPNKWLLIAGVIIGNIMGALLLGTGGTGIG